jgi:hypothetical protein
LALSQSANGGSNQVGKEYRNGRDDDPINGRRNNFGLIGTSIDGDPIVVPKYLEGGGKEFSGQVVYCLG